MALSSRNTDAGNNPLGRRLATYLSTVGAVGLAAGQRADGVVIADLTDRPFGINESVDIDFDGDGNVEFQLDHDRVELNGVTLDYLQLDKNDVNGALSANPVASELSPIDAFATFPGTPPDYSGDDLWNAADYTVWRDNQGQTGVPGDGNLDGQINQADYDVFVNSYGKAPAGGSKDHGYVSDQLLCGPFGGGGCYPSALEAGSSIGPELGYEFQESDNAFGNGTVLRTNRLIDEDMGQIDASFGSNPETIFDTPQFAGLGGAERFLGVRIDLSDAIYPDNPFPSINGPDDVDDPANYVYGWIGVQITNEADATGLVTGFAYESEPGVAIQAGDVGGGLAVAAPEPTSMLLAALCLVGVVGILLRRTRRAMQP
ncbi:hypothetical protein Pla123a_31440 [Posidoniimonas polymericola]|uniref:PEP-CTERM protein-sorting domain-containing protein n=1 Tax=Posidoniimonas polymericola TaxID=2528002 RepID=A0A5C5YL94_9BACT|nr:PEP-CTERM sorting domain-containing protein [Posidoniimonas polymericola]TWT75634.1 hypothetical protein Pla123a_31440 [Posidoniimonas polymericola]